MKRYALFGLAVLTASSFSFAWNDKYEINSVPFAPSVNGSTEIEMRRQFDYDPSNKYRGEIERDGSVRLRNFDGDTLRGNIDRDGYGRLRDEDGNSLWVRPR